MDEDSSVQPVFRPFKKRKVLRKRPDADEEDKQEVSTAPPSASPDAEQPTTAEDVEQSVNISSVIRARRMNKSRGHGIEFSSSSKSAIGGNADGSADTSHGELAQPQGIPDRFVAHADQLVDVDKHMVAYIESEMAKRYKQNQNSPQDKASTDHESSSRDNLGHSSLPPRQAASLGKLQEIDLGQDATLHNLQRTEAAIRRQRGEEETLDEGSSRKPRLGRNGKPRRGPKRRNSDDIKRDQLVEEVLRETRLDIYDDPASTVDQEFEEGDEDADERMAQRFRQEYIDAIQSRHRPRAPATTKSAKTANDVLKGPKLGGSRSARAAMHRHLEAEAAKK